MTLGTIVPPKDGHRTHDELEYFCPVCGVELALSNFLTPEADYYCPFCATRQTPAIV
jgi:hypothetical protein